MRAESAPSNWIVCLHRAGLDNTRHAVRSFLAQDIGNVRVLIFDRESTDGFSQWARAKYPEGPVTVLWDRNDSVSGAWNRALNLVFRHLNTDHALVVNNDVELRPDTYRLLLADGGGFVTAVGVRDKRKLTGPVDPASRSPHPDFSCFLIRRHVYEKVGPFDENYLGAFCEDTDYHCRMHRAGIAAISIDVPYYHVGSGTLLHLAEPEAKKVREQADRNRELFRRKWGMAVGSPEYEAFFRESA